MSVGHLKNYTKVLVPLNPELVGCKAEVVIEKGERFHILGKVVESSIKRLVPKPKGEGERGEEENCDELNYKVVESCVGDGCGEVEGGGEEKKEEGCCGGGECGSGKEEEKVEEREGTVKKEGEKFDIRLAVGVGVPAVLGVGILIYAGFKSYSRKR